MASLHLGNQFMYHMTMSGNWWAFFFIYLFIYSFSPPTVRRRDVDKKWNKNLISTVEYMFSQYFGLGTDEPVLTGLKKNDYFIRPSTDHHVSNVVAQWFNLTLTWKKATCRDLWSWNGIIYDWSVDIFLCKSLNYIASNARGQDETNPGFWLVT